MNRTFSVALSSIAVFASVACAACAADATPPAAAPPAAEVALITGTLKDPATAGATHDAVATQTQPVAQSLGDVGHFTAVGVADGAASLAIDLWSNTDGAAKLYGSPDFQAAAGGLYAAPPAIVLATLPEGWTTWGDLDYRKLAPRIFPVTIHGHLATADLEAAKQQHNAAAAALRPVSTPKGDVAHFVLASAADPRDVTFVDYWTTADAPPAFYGTPEAEQAFGGIFDAPPAVTLYASTTWIQW